VVLDRRGIGWVRGWLSLCRSKCTEDRVQRKHSLRDKHGLARGTCRHVRLDFAFPPDPYESVVVAMGSRRVFRAARFIHAVFTS
jgi:hypothetical protein